MKDPKEVRAKYAKKSRVAEAAPLAIEASVVARLLRDIVMQREKGS